ncbi:MAG: hypothetical protein LBH88_02665 [Candidatus Methanoplasma sp.]|jgi:hypothetical protein|nr:hypothetical protein [Candidatus Methanoplasma sp.]
MKHGGIYIDKKGLSAIVTVIILVVAVAVVAAGVYILTKDGDKSAEEEIIMGEFGIGSEFYYDKGSTIGSNAVPVSATSDTFVCSVTGMDEKYYFIEAPDVFTIGWPYFIKMHKTTGVIDWADSKGNNKWSFTILTMDGEEIVFELEVRSFDFGPMIYSMKITLDSRSVSGTIDVESSVLTEPTEYIQSDEIGKYCDYLLVMTMIDGPLGAEAKMEATLKMTASGIGADGKYVFVNEMHVKMTIKAAGMDDVVMDFDTRQMFVSDYAFDVPDDMPAGVPGKYTFEGEQKDVYIITVTEDGMSTVFYLDIDKPIVYYAEISETYPSMHYSVTVELTGTNF